MQIYITAVSNVMLRIFLPACTIVELTKMTSCKGGKHMKTRMMPASMIDVRYACMLFITATCSANKPMFFARGTGEGQSP